MFHKYLKYLLLFLVLTTLLSVIPYLLWHWHPYFLTMRHGEEMRTAVQHFVETQGSVKGNTDPETISTIATGDYLGYLLEVRCQSCSRIYVTTSVEVADLEVQVYSETHSKVFARIEFGWHWASPRTGELEDRCYAQAYNEIFIFERENSGDTWKVSGGEEVNRGTVDDYESPELRQRHCGG